MKRETLEKIWIWLVIVMVIIVCIIGAVALFDDNPLERLKYVFLMLMIGTPINILMMYFTCSAKM